ncbi:MAG: hypothetical protein KGL42_15115 [Betaproteobacteria bacterium]|nr:hypothetical protein [Betaproteobacteria bacterium]
MRRLLVVLLVLVASTASASQISRPSNRLGGSLTFTGATGVNRILFPDNLASAFWIGEGTTKYLEFRSTDAGEWIYTNKKFDVTSSADVLFWDTIHLTAASTNIYITDNGTTQFREAGNCYIQMVSTNNVETVVFCKPLTFDVLTSISATGTTQGAATALTHDINVVTTATTASADSVKLRAAAAGLHMRVKNRSGAATIQLFPESGLSTQICITTGCVAANASVTIANNLELDCIAESTTIVNCR